MRYEITGEDKDGKLIGAHRGTGIGRPRFWERAKYFNMDGDLGRALDALEESK
jgi:pilus assembly protein CpaF